MTKIINWMRPARKSTLPPDEQSADDAVFCVDPALVHIAARQREEAHLKESRRLRLAIEWLLALRGPAD